MNDNGFGAAIKIRPVEFHRLADYAHKQLGLNLPDSKSTLIESRLQKRLGQLGLPSFGAYADYLLTSQGQSEELPVFIDRITTHKTEFLREAEGFHYLIDHALPLLIKEGSALKGAKLRLWSAACSSGEEPYSLAMYLDEAFGNMAAQRFYLLASDVSEEMINLGQRGIYPLDRIQPLPNHWRHKYLLRSKDPKRQLFRIVPELRDRVQFRRINLLDQRHPSLGKFQVILVRNLLIYFDRETRIQLLLNLCNYLVKGGYLVVGHSESLHGMDLPLKQVHPMIYRRR